MRSSTNLKVGGKGSSVRFSLLEYTVEEDEPTTFQDEDGCIYTFGEVQEVQDDEDCSEYSLGLEFDRSVRSLSEENLLIHQYVPRPSTNADNNEGAANTQHERSEFPTGRRYCETKYIPSFHGSPRAAPIIVSRSFSGGVPSVASTDMDEDPSTFNEELEFARNLDIDFGVEARSLIRRIWQAIVGFAAFLDVLATVLSYYDGDLPEEEEEICHGPRTRISGIQNWIVANTDNISMMFSFVWFVDAFVLAHRQNKRSRIRLERQRLVLSDEDIRDKEFRTRVVHVVSILVQLLLLPTGLYLYIFRHTSDDKTRELLQDGLLVGLIKTTVRYYYTTMHEYCATALRNFVRRFLWRGLRHPLRLRRDIRRILRLIRWGRYLAPLGGNVGNLLRHLTEISALYRQKRLSRIAQKERAAFRGTLAEEELKQYCATEIQAAWRMRKARKFRVALALIRGDKDKLQYYTLQKKLRKSFNDGLAIAAQKHEKLHILEEKARELHRMKKELSRKELRDLYQLRQELQTEASQLLNKRLLLRPDAWFIVIWQNFFVVAVLIELAGLALIPVLEEKRPRDARPLTMAILLKQLFLPVPIHQRCYCVKETKLSLLRRVWKRIALVVMPLAKHRAVSAAAGTCISIPLDSWYCSHTYQTLQSFYIVLITFVIDRAMAIVGFMQFVDVFIHFFTGCIHPRTNQLVPQPFFPRWIFPGLLLDLALNPYMESTSRLLLSLFTEVVRNDPVRVIRWAVALYEPCSMVFVPVGRRVWSQFAHVCNCHCHRCHPVSDCAGGGTVKDLYMSSTAKLTQSFTQALNMLCDTAKRPQQQQQQRNPISYLQLGSPSTGNLLWI